LSDGCHEVSCKSDGISKDEAKCGLAFVDDAVDSLSSPSYEMQGAFEGEFLEFRSTLIDEALIRLRGPPKIRFKISMFSLPLRMPISS